MKKSFLTLCAVLACVMGFVACSSNDDEEKKVSIVGGWQVESATATAQIMPTPIPLTDMVKEYASVIVFNENGTMLPAEMFEKYTLENNTLTIGLTQAISTLIGMDKLTCNVAELTEKTLSVKADNISIEVIPGTPMTVSITMNFTRVPENAAR